MSEINGTLGFLEKSQVVLIVRRGCCYPNYDTSAG